MDKRTRKAVKHGYACGKQTVHHYPCAASVNFEHKSGKYVNRDDTSGNVAIAEDADGYLLGWALVGDITSNSTAGIDEVPVDTSLNSRYWMPADAAVTGALVGKTCDIVMSSTTQQADIGTGTTNVLKIYDVDVTNQYVLVGMNPALDPESVT